MVKSFAKILNFYPPSILAHTPTTHLAKSCLLVVIVCYISFHVFLLNYLHVVTYCNQYDKQYCNRNCKSLTMIITLIPIWLVSGQ